MEYNNITVSNFKPTYLIFGEIKIHLETGEVTGLSEDISEDAKRFWEYVRGNII
jgi:hypothetical protein